MKNAGIIFGGVLIVVIIVIAFTLMPKGEDRPPRESSDRDNENGEVITPEAPKDLQSFDYEQPRDWEHTERAQKAVQELAEGQMITFGIVKDPNDESHSYFATYAPDDEETLLSVYRYNTIDFSFERLFRASYAPGDFPGISESTGYSPIHPILHVLGYDTGKLILLAQDGSDSPGPCAEPILLADDPSVTSGATSEPVTIRRLVSMDLSDPYAKFEDYELPDEIRDSAQERQESCMNSM